MTTFCDLHSLTAPSQYGYKNGRSIGFPLFEQRKCILDSFEKTLLTLGLFLDFSKVFDCINHQRLITTLNNYGIRGVPLLGIEFDLNFRIQSVVIDGEQFDIKSVMPGVPQGSIRGPLLFNLYINVNGISIYPLTQNNNLCR